MKKIYGVALADGTMDLLMTDFVRFSSVRDEVMDWAHYVPHFWMLCGDWTVEEITDKLSSFFSVNTHRERKFMVTEIHNDTTNGFLPMSAWDWLKSTETKATVSGKQNPSLMDMCRAGEFDKRMKEVRSVADIDKLLEPYETNRSSFEIEAARNEMIKFYRNRQKLWSRGECYGVPQIVGIF